MRPVRRGVVADVLARPQPLVGDDQTAGGGRHRAPRHALPQPLRAPLLRPPRVPPLARPLLHIQAYFRGVECTLAVIGTGGPVKRINITSRCTSVFRGTYVSRCSESLSHIGVTSEGCYL
eukprot:8315633-Pyramimonas_sp.AAC.1